MDFAGVFTIGLLVGNTYAQRNRCEWFGGIDELAVQIKRFCYARGGWTGRVKVIHKLSEGKLKRTDFPIGSDREAFGAIGGAVVDDFFCFLVEGVIAGIPLAISVHVKDDADEVVGWHYIFGGEFWLVDSLGDDFSGCFFQELEDVVFLFGVCLNTDGCIFFRPVDGYKI